MAEEAQKKYNELVKYLDEHDSDEIKEDLKKMAEKATSGAKEELEKAKGELEKAKEDWDGVDIKEKLNDAREAMEEGVGKAKVLMGEGMDTVQKQWEELRKRLNI